jgi:hypothetical protein
VQSFAGEANNIHGTKVRDLNVFRMEWLASRRQRLINLKSKHQITVLNIEQVFSYLRSMW